MTRIVEHRQDAAGEEVFELRVFQLKEGDVYPTPISLANALTIE